jgi:ribosomal protein L6P/L9E
MQKFIMTIQTIINNMINNMTKNIKGFFQKKLKIKHDH